MIYKPKIKKIIVLFLLMGDVYYVLEGLWRGWANIIMLFVGGLCGVIIGLLNENKKFKIWQQCLLGTLIILIIEFISGLILNVWLKLNIWDYKGLWGNILGQICLPYAILWFCLVPVAIWLDDWFRYKLYDKEKAYKLIEVYKKLFKNE